MFDTSVNAAVTARAVAGDLPAPWSSALFASLPSFVSHDVEEVRQKVGAVFCEHDLHVVGEAQSLHTRLSVRCGRNVSYGCLLYGATVDIAPGKLRDFYLLQLPVRGAEDIHLGGRSSVLSDSRTGTIISPELGFDMRHSREAEKIFIRIERATFEQQCEQYYGRVVKGSLDFAPAIAWDIPAHRSLLRLLHWQLSEASDGVLFGCPAIASRREEILLVTLLETLQHNQRGDGRAAPVVAPAFVRRAEDYIREFCGSPLTAAGIARHVDVSVRSLFAGFRKYRDTTPMKFLRDVRLGAVRTALSEPASETTVTTTATEWGFSHLGQFAFLYRQRFHELPSATLRRHRDGGF